MCGRTTFTRDARIITIIIAAGSARLLELKLIPHRSDINWLDCRAGARLEIKAHRGKR